MIPSRFIAVCPKGHISKTFHSWNGFTGTGHWGSRHTSCDFSQDARPPVCPESKLNAVVGRWNQWRGPLTSTRRRGGALHRIGYDCSGGNTLAWRRKAGEASVGSILGLSNEVHPTFTFRKRFRPSISLIWGEGREAGRSTRFLTIPKVWNTLTAGLDDGKYIQTVRCETVASIYQVDSGRSERSRTEQTRRNRYEWGSARTAFRRGVSTAGIRGASTREEVSDATDLLVEVRDVSIRMDRSTEPNSSTASAWLESCGKQGCSSGFSRLLPVEDPSSAELLPISENDDLHWLPATVVHGEGIFFEFNPQKLHVWTENPKVQMRVSSLSEGYNQRRQERGLKEAEITAKYVLLHTFAHALIGQLSFDCGYGSASLRERIYCESDEPDQPMQGVLLYTASGDSEGTLGGLVRQGEPNQMRAVVERAIHRARWCSSDPRLHRECWTRQRQRQSGRMPRLRIAAGNLL